MSSLTTVKNAFANLCRGGAAALVALLLPPFLTRILSKDAYGTWLLILQLSTYVSLLDFGIQTAVGRFVAHHNELGEFQERDGIVSTALAILIGSGLLAIGGVSILAWQLPSLFKNMPAELHQDAQLALLCVGISLAVALPFSVFGGIFVGLQRYDVPGWIIGISKLLGGVFVVLIANASHSIVMMAVVMGIVNIGAGIWQFLAYRKLASDIRLSASLVSRSGGKEISTYCFSLSIWTLAMLLVSGLDTVIIGYFDYGAVTPYVLANSIVAIVAGIQSSVFSVLMPKAAALGSKGDSLALGRMLIDSTRYNMLILLAISIPLILFGEIILSFWVGEQYRESTALFLKILLVANLIRLSAYPYAIILIGTGQQQKVIMTPLVEGLSNFISSVFLASAFGGIGVVGGTIIGGLGGFLSNIFYNMRNTKEIENSLSTYFIDGLIKPILCFIPIIFASVFYPVQPNWLSVMVSTVMLILTLIVVFRFALVAKEREKIFLILFRYAHV
jgi:O-antigen/teichoic acid export membrane protein